MLRFPDSSSTIAHTKQRIAVAPNGGHAPPIQSRVALAALYKILYIRQSIKPLFWVGSSLDDVRAFPDHARRRIGHQLHLVQMGIEPDDWKPMTAVGTGVYEIRVHLNVEYRVLYVARFADGIHVLHAFVKRTQRTPALDIELARKRLAFVTARHRRHAR